MLLFFFLQLQQLTTEDQCLADQAKDWQSTGPLKAARLCSAPNQTQLQNLAAKTRQPCATSAIEIDETDKIRGVLSPRPSLVLPVQFACTAHIAPQLFRCETAFAFAFRSVAQLVAIRRLPARLWSLRCPALVPGPRTDVHTELQGPERPDERAHHAREKRPREQEQQRDRHTAHATHKALLIVLLEKVFSLFFCLSFLSFLSFVCLTCVH